MSLTDILFPHKCEIVTQTESVGYSGQPVYTNGTTTTGVRCHWQPQGTRETARRGTWVVERDRMFFPAGTTIDESMLVQSVTRVSDDASIAAGPFNVLSVSVFDGSHIEVEVEQTR